MKLVLCLFLSLTSFSSTHVAASAPEIAQDAAPRTSSLRVLAATPSHSPVAVIGASASSPSTRGSIEGGITLSFEQAQELMNGATIPISLSSLSSLAGVSFHVEPPSAKKRKTGVAAAPHSPSAPPPGPSFSSTSSLAPSSFFIFSKRKLPRQLHAHTLSFLELGDWQNCQAVSPEWRTVSLLPHASGNFSGFFTHDVLPRLARSTQIPRFTNFSIDEPNEYPPATINKQRHGEDHEGDDGDEDPLRVILTTIAPTCRVLTLGQQVNYAETTTTWAGLSNFTKLTALNIRAGLKRRIEPRPLLAIPPLSRLTSLKIVDMNGGIRGYDAPVTKNFVPVAFEANFDDVSTDLRCLNGFPSLTLLDLSAILSPIDPAHLSSLTALQSLMLYQIPTSLPLLPVLQSLKCIQGSNWRGPLSTTWTEGKKLADSCPQLTNCNAFLPPESMLALSTLTSINLQITGAREDSKIRELLQTLPPLQRLELDFYNIPPMPGIIPESVAKTITTLSVHADATLSIYTNSLLRIFSSLTRLTIHHPPPYHNAERAYADLFRVSHSASLEKLDELKCFKAPSFRYDFKSLPFPRLETLDLSAAQWELGMLPSSMCQPLSMLNELRITRLILCVSQNLPLPQLAIPTLRELIFIRRLHHIHSGQISYPKDTTTTVMMRDIQWGKNRELNRIAFINASPDFGPRPGDLESISIVPLLPRLSMMLYKTKKISQELLHELAHRKWRVTVIDELPHALTYNHMDNDDFDWWLQNYHFEG